MNLAGYCLFCLLILSVTADPRAYDLRIRENQPLEFRKYGNSESIDYFRLLEIDDSHLIIGAADNVHNISIDQFERISLYEWPSSQNEINDCIMKIDDQTACRNYIRVLSRSEDDGTLLICGTNAFQPLCRLINSKHEKLLEFVGTAISPLDPRHNTSFLRDGDLLYSATVADFYGNDALVFRRNITKPEDRGIRTQRQNIMLLNKPQFVGTLQSEKYIYFFFREEATESSEATIHSRVARVCKNDRGGPQGHETEWTTFAKARLNCSILEKSKPFYFDEIISVSGITHNWNGKPKNLVYATFVSEFNFLRHSVVCAFGIDEIDKLFGSSDILTRDLETGKWIRKTRQDHQGTSKLGQCSPNSRDLTEEEVIQMRKTPLLADSVPNLFGKAVGIHRGSDNYNQIVVLEGVQSFDGLVDVLYVGTDQGNVIKMVNLGVNKITGEMDRDPVHQVAVFKTSDLPIRRLLITKNKYLIVVTDPVVYRLPLHLCSSYDSCESCISSRDPHCYWKQGECRSISASPRPKLSYQDILSKQPNICVDAKKHDKPKVTTTTFEVRKTEMPKIIKEKYKNITFGALTVDGNEVCNCTAIRSHAERRKCHCPNLEDLIQPVVSEELSVSPWSRIPWWVYLILILAFFQTLGLIILCVRLRKRRMSKKKGQSSQKQMLSVINAYAPTITDAIPSKIGPTYATYDTFRR